MNSTDKVYFYLYPPKYSEDNSYMRAYHYYQHAPVALAEGFKDIGIEFYSNIDYWKLYPDKNEYLFQHHPDVLPEDCSIIIVDHISFLHSGRLPDVFHKDAVLVYLDLSDEDPRKDIFHDDFRRFDLIFKAHCSQFSWYPSNVRPWFFGLTNRILISMKTLPDFESRNQNILINFRHSQHPHTLRLLTEKIFVPKIHSVLPVDRTVDQPINPLSKEFDPQNCGLNARDLMHCVQTSGRHFPQYYERLTRTAAVACFGGFFISPWPANQSSTMSKNLRRLVTKLNLQTSRIIQWDSWRWWEALAAGCVPFHVDFEKYGFCLPVMPENWKHYIGIDLDNVQASIDRIIDDPKLLPNISLAGRKWALEHYNPTAIAQYFMDTVSTFER